MALGVFVALLAEDWRQGANERTEERRALDALRVEFAESRASFNRRMVVYAAREQAILAILEVIRGAAVPDVDSLDTLFGWSIRLGSWDPSTGALNSIIASGDLQLISNMGLRSSLAQWPSVLDDYNQVEDVYRDLILDHYRPYLRETVGLPNRLGEQGHLPPNSTPVRLVDVLSDPMLEQMLRELAAYGANLQRGLQANRIRELLSDIEDGVLARR